MAWYGVAPTWRVLTLPLFVAVAAALALGVGLWLAALSVRYRDIRHLTPFLVQFGLYLSPVGFSSNLVQRSIACSLASTPWWASSMASAGPSWTPPPWT